MGNDGVDAIDMVAVQPLSRPGAGGRRAVNLLIARKPCLHVPRKPGLWHDGIQGVGFESMTTPALANRLVEALHVEAHLLVDESNAYFGGPGRTERDQLDPRSRVIFACEALKATTRMMQLIAWLTTHRGKRGPRTPLAEAAESDEPTLALLPSSARRLILAGIELHQRTRRLAELGETDAVTAISPARNLLERLEQAF